MGVDYAVFANLAGVTDEAAASQAAAQTWNADRCDFTFTYVGPGSNNAPAYDGVNQIRWGNTGGSFVTRTMWLNMTTGDISEVDCVLGESFAWSTATPTPASAFDIESVLLHEFGHFLGLDHSTPPAIMQPTIPPGTQRRNLDTDDGAGCQAIYGTEQVGTPKPITVIGLFVLLVVALGALLSLRRNLVRA